MNSVSVNTVRLDSTSVSTIGLSSIGVPSINKKKEPEWISHIVARYSAKGRTNEDTNRTILPDLSDNGRDIELKNLSYIDGSGFKNNAVYFDGIDDYGICSNMPLFNTTDGYTIIVKRTTFENSNGAVVCKSSPDKIDKGSFIFEGGRAFVDNTWSFGANNKVTIATNEISYMTRNSYNGVSIKSGNSVDDATFVIGGYRYYKGAIYDLILLDKDYPKETIEEIIKYFNL